MFLTELISRNNSAGLDPETENFFWITAYQALAQSRGSLTRILILQNIEQQPMNANQLADLLDIDYKTLKHHLRVLQAINFVSSSKNRYGSTYHLTEYFRSHKFLIKVKWSAPNAESLSRKIPKQSTTAR